MAVKYYAKLTIYLSDTGHTSLKTQVFSNKKYTTKDVLDAAMGVLTQERESTQGRLMALRMVTEVWTPKGNKVVELKPLKKLERIAAWRLGAFLRGQPLDWDDNLCHGLQARYELERRLEQEKGVRYYEARNELIQCGLLNG